MPLYPIPFGGLRSLEADELVPIDAALDATNCYIDQDTIAPRNGYRAALPSKLTGGTTLTSATYTSSPDVLYTGLKYGVPQVYSNFIIQPGVWTAWSLSVTATYTKHTDLGSMVEANIICLDQAGNQFTSAAYFSSLHTTDGTYTETFGNNDNLILPNSGGIFKVGWTGGTFASDSAYTVDLVSATFSQTGKQGFYLTPQAGTTTSGGTPLTITANIPGGVYTAAQWIVMYKQTVNTGSNQFSVTLKTPSASSISTSSGTSSPTVGTAINATAGQLADINTYAGGSMPVTISGNYVSAGLVFTAIDVVLVLTGTTTNVQAFNRFRPSSTAARSVATVGGAVNIITDPSSELVSDGAATSLGTIFGATDKISAAQLGKYLYVGADSGLAWIRVKPDFTYESLSNLTAPAAPTTSAATSISLTKFNTLTINGASTGTVTTSSITDNLDVHGAEGTFVIYDIGAAKDCRAIKWLFVSCTPQPSGNGASRFTIEVSTSSGGGWETLDEISDTVGDDTPCAAYLSLQSVSATTQQALRYIRFRKSFSSGIFQINGFFFLPTPPAAGAVDYFVTAYNSSTLQESAASDTVTVNYSTTSVAPPSFHAAIQRYNSVYDGGILSSNPDNLSDARLWNKGAGKTYPSSSDFGPVETFSGTSPSGSFDTIRLWRIADNGTRLVNSVTNTPTTSYSITDSLGDVVLSNALYKASGPPPPCVAAAAYAGRLCAGGNPANPNRLSISSYVPFGSSTDPFPQFPPDALEDADGWSFDVSETASEQILSLVTGDALYILTSERVGSMADLTPNSVVNYAIARGVLGRRGACWAEDRLFYAAYDGIYAISNRTDAREMSVGIRRLYKEWFAPDSSVVVTYQNRRLLVYCNSKYLRYDFVGGTSGQGRWTRGTVAHNFQHPAAWRDPLGTWQNMWFLAADGQIYRWQPADVVGSANAATTDANVTIPAWTYSTGYEFTPVKMRIEDCFIDVVNAGVTISAFYTASLPSPIRSISVAVGEHEVPMFADVTGYKLRLTLADSGGATVRRLLWSRMPSDGRGA